MPDGVMQKMVIGTLGTISASVTVKQSSMPLNICMIKIKINSKHFTYSRMVPKHPKW